MIDRGRLAPALLVFASLLGGCRGARGGGASDAAHDGAEAITAVDAGAAIECLTAERRDVRASVCRVDLRRQRLRLFLDDEHGRPFGGFDAIDRWLAPHGQRLAIAMNAGMFAPDRRPVGLFVEGGVERAPLRRGPGEGNFFLEPNGVFLVSDAGARVVETSEYPALRERVVLATQSGPLLVRAGEIHPAFRADSASRLVRNGIGVVSPDVVVLAISDEPARFYDFAVLFRDDLHCRDALYLDGTVSRLYAPALNRRDVAVGLGPILGVVVDAR